MSTLRAKIAGCGSYAPPDVLTNRDLEKALDTSDSWITTRTGIKERRVSLDGKTSKVAARAAKNALASAGLQPKDIDLVVTGTVTPDMVFPSTSCFVQSELGLRPGIPAFDVSAACSGFLYALDVADKYVSAGASKKALVIGVDLFSKIVDWTDRSTCVLFGDGAGAVVLTPTRGKSGVLSSHIHSDGRKWDMLYAPGACQGGTLPPGLRPARPAHAAPPHVRMNGNETFKVAVKTMRDAVCEALEHNGLGIGDVSLLIPHQANIRIMNAIQERLGLGDEQVFSNIDRFGNTSAGSIPLALDEAVRAGRLKKGDILVLVSFGGGLTWASAAIRW